MLPCSSIPSPGGPGPCDGCVCPDKWQEGNSLIAGGLEVSLMETLSPRAASLLLALCQFCVNKELPQKGRTGRSVYPGPTCGECNWEKLGAGIQPAVWSRLSQSQPSLSLGPS